MYIKKVVLENIRCIKKLELDLSSPGESALIAADNGDGKTTLLQSIAMGLCDESSAAALFRELPGEFVRKGANSDARIEVLLENEAGHLYGIHTKIQSFEAFERVRQPSVWIKINGKKKALKQDSFPWGQIFACGYGAGRQAKGTADLDEYTVVDAVYTLFRYYEPLENPELALRRLVDKARATANKDPKEREKRAEEMLERLSRMLKHVLNLEDKDQVNLTPSGIEVKAHWGRQKLVSLGDGHKAMTTCVLDLLSCYMLSGRSIDPQKMRGIVLIDEIEQHLHPRWQLRIMDLLHDSFPKMQFIATTHSPLVVSGCKYCKVHRMRAGEYEAMGNMHGWLAEDVYRELMDIADSRSPTFKTEVLDKFDELHSRNLGRKANPADLREYKRLRKKLAALPESDPIALTTEIQNITDSLRKLRNQDVKIEKRYQKS